MTIVSLPKMLHSVAKWGNRAIGNWAWGPAIMPQLELSPIAEQAGYGKLPMTIALNDPSGTFLRAMQQRLNVFRCPSGADWSSELNSLFTIEGHRLAMSNYVGNNGSYSFRSRLGNLLQDASVNTGFQNGMFAEVGSNPHHRGPGFRRLSEVSDGATNTILLGERCWQTHTIDYGAAVVWGVHGHVAAAGADKDGYLAVLGCGWVSINSAAGVRDSRSAHRRGFSSNHPGGAQFVFVDGSVHFISQHIDHADATSAELLNSTYSRLLAADDGGAVPTF
jgi:prepilin-type processing-associated H-X9-DG protein